MRLDWYNENANRAYPFIFDPMLSGGALPKACILDAGFWVGPAAGAGTQAVDIYLKTVQRTGGLATFIFGSRTLPELTFTFTRALPATPNTVSYATAALAGTTVPEAGTAFLVTGEALDTMPVGTLVAASTVEPTCVQVDSLSYVSGLNLANDPDPVFGGQGGVTARGAAPAVVPRGRVQGSVIFHPGYNAVIRVAAAGNALIFGADAGAGEGQPCDYVWRGLSSSSLGCACNTLFYAINDQGPDDHNDFKLYGGNGVSIVPDAANHKVFVYIDYQAVLQGCSVTP